MNLFAKNITTRFAMIREKNCPESTFAENAKTNIQLKNMTKTGSAGTAEHFLVLELFLTETFLNENPTP